MISSLSRKIGLDFKLLELILFPSRCQICSKPLESRGERVVCLQCLDSLKARSASYCLSCGRFFETPGQPHLCGSCLELKPPFSIHRSCGRYRNTLKDMILLFKYRGYKVLGKDLAGFMLNTLGSNEEIWWGVDALIPVPLHPKRKRERGFNQAWVLAKQLAKEKGMEVMRNNLVRTGIRPPQTLIEVFEREKNIRGIFGVKDVNEIKEKTFLLVDDVYTTGATLKECSKTLLRAGAKDVRAVTLAQA